MPRLQELYKGNLPPHIRSKVQYIREQRRIYERIDKKFVGIGFKLEVRPMKGPDSEFIIVLDDQLVGYF